MKCRIKEAATRLLEMFETGKMPEAIARTMIRRESGDNRPCDEWSLGKWSRRASPPCNQILEG